MAKDGHENEQQTWLIEQQAVRLAMLYLTSNGNFQIKREVKYSNLSDFIVDVVVDLAELSVGNEPDSTMERKLGIRHEANHFTPRRLGIEVKGSLGAITQVQLPEFKTKVTLSEDLNLVKYSQIYPLCVLAFDIRMKQAYFRWVIEPVLHDPGEVHGQVKWNLRFGDRQNSVGLVYEATEVVNALTEQQFTKQLRAVTAWYDTIDHILET
jgi:hypothetical protein